MKAVVIHEAGGPEVLQIEERVVPVPVCHAILGITSIAEP